MLLLYPTIVSKEITWSTAGRSRKKSEGQLVQALCAQMTGKTENPEWCMVCVWEKRPKKDPKETQKQDTTGLIPKKTQKTQKRTKRPKDQSCCVLFNKPGTDNRQHIHHIHRPLGPGRYG